MTQRFPIASDELALTTTSGTPDVTVRSSQT